MNTIDELEGSLQKLLLLLKKNRDAVDRRLLKTIYKRAYDNLLAQINQAATAYVHEVVIRGLVLNPDIPIEIQVDVMNQTIAQSGILQEMGKAISKNYDVGELYQLALLLREKIELALWPYINLQTCLVADLFDLEKEPVIYNTLTQKIYINDTWVDHPIDLQGKLLVYSRQKGLEDKKNVNIPSEKEQTDTDSAQAL